MNIKLNKHPFLGFTLVELMIVVVIIGVLASFALPVYRNYIDKVHFSEAIQKTGSLKKAIVTYLQTHPYNSDPNHQWATTLDVTYNGSNVTAHYMYVDYYFHWNGTNGACQIDKTYTGTGTALTLSNTYEFDSYGDINKSPCSGIGTYTVPIPMPSILPHNDQQKLRITMQQYAPGYQPAVLESGSPMGIPIRGSLSIEAGCRNSFSGVGPECSTFTKGTTPEVTLLSILRLDQSMVGTPDKPSNEMSWFNHSESTCLAWTGGSLC